MPIVEITSRPRLSDTLREAWTHRQLAFLLARRNLKVRYMQTALGSIWVVIQPLLLTGALTVVLGVFLAVPSDGVPYGLFALSGMAVWSMFQRAVAESGLSLAASGNIVQKVYFPRILVPLSAVITAVVDFAFVYAVLLLGTIVMGYFPGWPILLSPLFALLGAAMALACGICVTVVDAVFRDVRHAVPSLLQLMFYASPVVYSDAIVPDHWRWLFQLNPLVGVIKGFRWSTLAGVPPPAMIDIAWSVGFTGLTLAFGLMLFGRFETLAVDRI